jgi:dTDP-4-dehydrorhamnose reductase
MLLIHISTDYVFDGRNYRPYTEEDPTGPQSVYAKSKFAGEEQVIGHAARALIIRTSWLYSEFGQNFLKTIRKYGKERGLLRVVSDQIGSPTYALDLAKTLLDILSRETIPDGVHIYHYANEGVASWYDFASAILEMNNIRCTLTPIPTKDYPLPAVRPFYSVLDKSKIRQDFGIEIPYWRDSLLKCIGRLETEL